VTTLSRYVALSAHPEQLGVCVSCDTDDTSMSTTVEDRLHQVLGSTAWHRIFRSSNKTKIEACNANMSEIDWDWQIVVLVSDDMIPQLKGWDDVIRNHMIARYPDTNGILWFNDGFQGEKLNTLSIYGRAMYNELGHIYSPEYKSLFCDTELTDRCRGDLAHRTTYIPYCIIRHEHPGTGYVQNMDALYQHNQRFWNDDMYTYIRRKTYPYDMTFLIATIPGREGSLQRLIQSIREKMGRIAPGLRYEIRLGFDNKEMTIGDKRERLIKASTGKYSAFIDDDDEITDEYIEDMSAMISQNCHVMRLRGKLHQYTFTHTVDAKLSERMAIGDEFRRPPNHLNPMLTDVAKLVRFKDASRGEDLDWTIRMAKSGFLVQEYKSDPSRLHYIYNMRESVSETALVFQRATSYDEMLSMVWTSQGPRVPDAVPPPQAFSVPILRLTSRGFVSR
jgi:hypothetical protein